jgi:hypothetical protein
MASAVELPAVIRALHTVALNLAIGQRRAAMRTDIAQTMRPADSITKQHKVLTEHAHPDGLLGHIIAELSGVPEIYKHCLFRFAKNLLLSGIRPIQALIFSCPARRLPVLRRGEPEMVSGSKLG